MDNDFPKDVYKVGGQYEIDHKRYAIMTVNTPDELAAAESDGWRDHPVKAYKFTAEQKAAAEALAKAPAADAPKTDAPPTRAELEALATAKRIRFSASTTDTELAKLITAA